MSAHVEARSVSRRFGATVALSGASLTLEPGTTTTLVGPSGCGKTTLLRCLAGLQAPDSGEILFDGRSVLGMPAERRGVGFVFQSYALFPHLTVAENIAFGLEVRRAPREDRDRRVREVAEALGLTPLLRRRPAEISGGERQRVALGRAIAYRPVLLLLDEPLAALDPNLAASVRDVLSEAIAREETTVLFVTHDRADALRIGDRVAVMRDGAVEQQGTPEEVYRRPISEFVARFFGGGTVWDGVAVRNGSRSVIETPLGAVAVADRFHGPVRVVLRPEAVRPAPPGAGRPFTVREAVFEGNRYSVRIEGLEELAAIEWPPERPVSRGDRICVSIEPSLLVVLPATQGAKKD